MIEPTYRIEESEELLHPGHLACQGCGATIAIRYVLKALGKRTVVIIPACCWSIISGLFPSSCLDVPLIHTAFETAAAAATGARAALDMQGQEDVNVLAWAGDGGTFDIGFQALSGAAERNENILYCCYDNEAYMNTGIQRSSATPIGAWTTTTPKGGLEDRPKKDIVQIMAAHNIPYTATANVAFPDDLYRKAKKAASIKGMKFIHILSPCPTGWRIPSSESVEVARLATLSNLFPLYEVEHGSKLTITYHPTKTVPVSQYLDAQARFRLISAEEKKQIQKNVDAYWKRLLEMSGK
ncbi:MAG: pyruvate synthase subunit beta [Deltaproteobacteria bacterium]|nr:MAG: pyruvate synthase subunit beta [Deltaproteobacteria bacterium]